MDNKQKAIEEFLDRRSGFGKYKEVSIRELGTNPDYDSYVKWLVNPETGGTFKIDHPAAYKFFTKCLKEREESNKKREKQQAEQQEFKRFELCTSCDAYGFRKILDFSAKQVLPKICFLCHGKGSLTNIPADILIKQYHFEVQKSIISIRSWIPAGKYQGWTLGGLKVANFQYYKTLSTHEQFGELFPELQKFIQKDLEAEACF